MLYSCLGMIHENADTFLQMLAESDNHQGTDLKAIRAIIKKARILQQKSYELAFKELSNCYAHLSIPMGGHQPMQEVNYEFQYWSSLAFIYLSLQQDDQLIQACQMLSHRFPKKLEALRLLVDNGTSFRECGKYDKAQRVFELAKKIISKFDEPNEELDRLQAVILSNQSLICIDTSTYTLAIQKMGKAIEKDPRNFQYLCIIPSFYIWDKDYERIRREIERCKEQIFLDKQRYSLKKYQALSSYLDYWDQTTRKLMTISEDSFKTFVNRQILAYVDLIESCSSIPQQEKEEIGLQTEAAYIQDQVQNRNPIGRLKYQIQADFKQFDHKGNQNLRYFYDGFCNAFQGSYTQAKIMARNRFTFNTDNLAVSVASKIASFLPFFGELASTAIENIGNYITEAQLVRMSNNVFNLNICGLKFDDFAHEVGVEITKSRDSFLKGLDSKLPVIYGWPNSFIRFIEYLKMKKEQLQDKLLGEGALLKNEIEKYGYIVASKLISTYVATGDIYDKSKSNGRENKAQIIKKLIDKATQIIDYDIQQYSSEKQVFLRKIIQRQIKSKQEKKKVNYQPIPQPFPKPINNDKKKQKISFFAKCCACLK